MYDVISFPDPFSFLYVAYSLYICLFRTIAVLLLSNLRACHDILATSSDVYAGSYRGV